MSFCAFGGVFGIGAAALVAESGEFDQHFRGVGGVAVAEVAEVVVTALKPSLPVWLEVAVFRFLGAGGDGDEELAMGLPGAGSEQLGSRDVGGEVSAKARGRRRKSRAGFHSKSNWTRPVDRRDRRAGLSLSGV